MFSIYYPTIHPSIHSSIYLSILSYLILSYLLLSYLILSYLILSIYLSIYLIFLISLHNTLMCHFRPGEPQGTDPQQLSAQTTWVVRIGKTRPPLTPGSHGSHGSKQKGFFWCPEDLMVISWDLMGINGT